MITVIGLGSAGCNIAEMFESQETFKVKLIDVDIEGDNCFSLPNFEKIEDFEEKLPDLSLFLSDCTKKVLFIVGGSGKVSASSLKILSHIKDREISVVYIRPDIELMSNFARMQDKLTFNVLQEYSRSGIFKKIYLISNSEIETILGDSSIIDYYYNLNNIIYNTILNIISLEGKKCIIDNSTEPPEMCRISTLGIYNLENDIEKLFYNFDYIDDQCYYFIINENKLKNDGKLFKEIKDKIKKKMYNNIKISYKIFSTTLEQNYCYVQIDSRKIQQ